MANMKTVAIIVVTYNRLKMLRDCIEALRAQTFKDRDIIVVNNGSTDGTGEYLSAQADVTVIEQRNCGGAGGFFTGIKYSCEKGYKYSWVMDDDVVPEKDALEKLIVKYHTGMGFLCSRVLDANGRHCNVPYVSKRCDSFTGEYLWGECLNDNMLRVDVTSFVSLLVDNAVVYEVGLPYREYFIWGDDTEWTLRISRKHACYMVSDSVVHHLRAINRALDISYETNDARMSNYFYLYRNNIHAHKGWSKIKAIGFGVLCCIKLLICGKLKKSMVVFKGTLSGIFFNPKIQYPGKQ